MSTLTVCVMPWAPRHRVPATPYIEGSWSIECTSNAPSLDIHAYLDDVLSGWSRGVTFDNEVETTTMCAPSTADRCLSVGAYLWQNPEIRDGVPGQLAPYSSAGPRMNGGKTMEITAASDPYTPYPSIEDPAEGFAGLLFQNNYRIFSGTSGSGPHVAAVAAQLLEVEPGLTSEQVTERIFDGAGVDELVDADAFPDDVWGYGRLRAYGAIYDEPAPARPELVERDLSVEFLPDDGQCIAMVRIDAVDWPSPSFRWDDDYDGSWDTDFIEGIERAIGLTVDAPTIDVRLEAVVAGQLAVAAIEHGLVVDPEGGADDRGLEVVRDEDTGDRAQLLEGLDVQTQPGLDLLVEDDAGHHVARVAQHHHEDVGLAHATGLGIPQLADAAEVDLSDLPGLGVDGDRHIVGVDPLGRSQPRAQALDRRHAAAAVLVLEAEAVIDRRRCRSAVAHLRDLVRPLGHRRDLLRLGLEGCVSLHRLPQFGHRGQLFGRAREQRRGLQCLAIPALGVGAHLEQAGDLATAVAHPVQPHEFLEAMHVNGHGDPGA